MEIKSTVLFLHSLFVFFLSICETKVCRRIESITVQGGEVYAIKYHCCSDYVTMPDGCKKCTAGFVSNAAQNGCNPCPKGNWGVECALDCFCGPTERCDNIVGCVTKTDNDEIECDVGYELEEMECVPCHTDFYGFNSSLKCDCKDDERCDTVAGCVNKQTTTQVVESTITKSTTEESVKTEKVPNNSAQTLCIYVGSTIGVIIAIGAITCHKRCRNGKYNTPRKRTPLPNPSDQNFVGYAHAYAEIDESLLKNEVIPNTRSLKNNASKAQDEETKDSRPSQIANDGYIDPLPSVSNIRQDIHMQPIVTEEQIVNLGKNSVSGYVHSYQPVMQKPTDKHEYAKPNEVDKKIKSVNVHPIQTAIEGNAEKYRYIDMNGQIQKTDDRCEPVCDLCEPEHTSGLESNITDGERNYFDFHVKPVYFAVVADVNGNKRLDDEGTVLDDLENNMSIENPSLTDDIYPIIDGNIKEDEKKLVSDNIDDINKGTEEVKDGMQ